MKGWQHRDALQQWQEQQVRQHLARVVKKSPFFAEHAAQHGIDHWRQWPVSNKAEMMSHFDDWNTAGIRLEDAWNLAVNAERTRDFSGTLNGITVGLSSGTSGTRGVFLASPAERSLWAGTMLARVLRGTLLNEHRAALFFRADSPLYQTVGSRRFQFAFFDLLQPIEEQWSRLQDFQPTVLAAPPSALLRLAEQEGAGKLLKTPSILLSVADVLDEEDRYRIENGFGCAVGQLYQATEGFLAATCAHGRMHWNEDAVVIEKQWIDDSRQRYCPVITDFRRLTQPIIRYRLDDVITEDHGPRCPCGSIFGTLGGIEGRCDDVLLLSKLEGAGAVFVFPDFVRRAIVLAVPSGLDYTVTQRALDRWEVSLSQSCDVEPIKHEVEALCQRLNGCPPTLQFVEWKPHPIHAKRRRIRCEIPGND
jgi:putative adenylate-forming enzyme